MPEIVLHALPPSHPCMTVDAALRLKGLEFERVDLAPGTHNSEMVRIYGEGNHTVPGAVIDGEPVHGSRPILERLELLEPEPPLYPEPIADAVREAERWGDAELQDLGRRLPWGDDALPPRGDGDLRRRRAARSGRDRLRDPLRPRVLEVPPDHRCAPGRGPRRAARARSITSTGSPRTA